MSSTRPVVSARPMIDEKLKEKIMEYCKKNGYALEKHVSNYDTEIVRLRISDFYWHKQTGFHFEAEAWRELDRQISDDPAGYKEVSLLERGIDDNN